MVDATPDASHIEQTTFILRYLIRENESYMVQERFLAFVDCWQKTGIEIANLILETLKGYGIPISDCRGQGYDNAANMSGKYNGAQKHINTVNPLCLYSPCGCHSLNLLGADSAESCPKLSPILAWFKQSTTFSLVVLNDGTYYNSTLHALFMACPEQDG